MSLETFNNEHWQEFRYFSDEDGANGNIAESYTSPNGKRWRLGSIKLHASVSFASVQDFVVKVSSADDNRFDIVLLSQAMNGIKDVLLQFANPVFLQSDEILKVSLPMTSGTNSIGIELGGWSVSGI